MIEHNGYSLSDIGRDTGPHRACAKREWLGCIFAERRREQLQRLDVSIVHNLTTPRQNEQREEVFSLTKRYFPRR